MEQKSQNIFLPKQPLPPPRSNMEANRLVLGTDSSFSKAIASPL